MERVRRLQSLWSWLPAFRVVAETEHLPTASKKLGITRQALSRSIKLLEENLDRELFLRIGRRLQLTEAGRDFLQHVRAAMRNLDDAVCTGPSAECRGPARIAALAQHAWILIRPVLETLRIEQPNLVPHIVQASRDRAVDGLRQGEFDVALGEFPVPHPAITIEPLIEMRSEVFCGPSHPLFRRRLVTREELIEHPFVAPTAGISDGWPVAERRTIGVCVTSFQFAIELCAAGQYLAMLPSDVVELGSSSRTLRRVPIDLSTPLPVFIGYRKPVGEHRLTLVLLEALRDAATSLGLRRRGDLN